MAGDPRRPRLGGARDEAIAAGWFGERVADDVRERIGDVVAAARDSAVMVRRTVEPAESALIGHHGSLTTGRAACPTAARYASTANLVAVIVLLPPSETKRDGGDGPPLPPRIADLAGTGPDACRAGRRAGRAGRRPPRSRRALGISAAQDAEIDRNAALRSAPTMPAIDRYTGVLYDALDIESLRGAAASRARCAAGRRVGAVRAAARRRPGARLPAVRRLEAARAADAGRALAAGARAGAGRAGRATS